MGPKNLCSVTPRLNFFFSVSRVTSYKNFYFVMSHFKNIIHYIIIMFYKTSMSIFVFYKISMSILQFLQDFDVTFYSSIKAHVGFYNF